MAIIQPSYTRINNNILERSGAFELSLATQQDYNSGIDYYADVDDKLSDGKLQRESISSDNRAAAQPPRALPTFKKHKKKIIVTSATALFATPVVAYGLHALSASRSEKAETKTHNELLESIDQRLLYSCHRCSLLARLLAKYTVPLPVVTFKSPFLKSLETSFNRVKKAMSREPKSLCCSLSPVDALNLQRILEYKINSKTDKPDKRALAMLSVKWVLTQGGNPSEVLREILQPHDVSKAVYWLKNATKS